MKTIIINSPTHGEKKILVDDELFPDLMKINWNVVNHGHTFYARMHKTINGKHCKVYMHRFILGLTNSKIKVDHKDHNGLNNQRSNIRKCNQSENLKNRTSRKNGSSKYLGVGSSHGKWRSFIMLNGRYKHLGTFNNEIDAAKAYDVAALTHHKEFANLNFKS